MRFHGASSQIRCLAHILHLVVKDILKVLDAGDTNEAKASLDNILTKGAEQYKASGAIYRLRLLVLWISRTPARRQKWHQLCAKMVQYDVDTRWNSTYIMLSDALRCQQELIAFTKDPDYSDISALALNMDEWTIIRQICDILAPFDEWTRTVSTSRSTIAVTMPIYYEIGAYLKAISSQSDLDISIRNAVTTGLVKYNKYHKLAGECVLYWLALFLDPRVKCDWFKLRLSNKANNEVLSNIRKFIRDEYNEQSIIPTSAPDTSFDSVELRMLRALNSTNEASGSEIDRYITSPTIVYHPVGGIVDPQWVPKWWKANANEWPLLTQVARDILAIPPSEVPVERLFNTGRDMVGLRRSDLGAETMRVLMILKDDQNRQLRSQ